MSKNFIPVLLLLILGGLFVTYGVMGNNDKGPQDPNEKYQKILRNVGIVLEQGHYHPKKIDDKFSAEVLHNFEQTLDPDKIIFTAKDIQNFEKFANRIDDEIHGAPIQSFYVISETYMKRFDELEGLYKKALKEPMSFTREEYLQTDGEKRDYPEDSKERYEYARKRMKYQVLIRYADLQEERDSSKDEKKADSTLLREAVQTVTKQIDRYFETLRNHNTTDELFSTFVNAITSTMDPHTTYMAPVDKRTFDEMLSGTFYGIGAQLKEEDGKIKVASLITGMPAWKSGEIQPEDVIMKVGQGDKPPVDVTGYALTDAVKLIRGEKKGSEVRLTLKKTDGSIKVVSLLRDEINLEDTYAKSAIIEGAHKIGYIRLPEFYANFNDPSGRRSATDVAIEVQKLKDAHVDGIVIDLRGNGGGSLQDVVDMVGLFVKDGPVVQVKGRGEKASVLSSQDDKPLYTGPLAVMVDELSASASEIFAAAIQDYHRGIVIGSSSTFGKGTVQRSVSLDPQSESLFFNKPAEGLGNVKLTFRKFYRISGGATQLRGVVPDIIIPDRFSKAKFREKDTPDALGWDTISRVKYAIWNPGYGYEDIVRTISQDVKTNPNFTGIQSVVDKLEEMREEEVPLQIDQFKAMQAKLRRLSKELDSYTKPEEPLNVESLRADLESNGIDQKKKEDQQKFIQAISNDIYVAETVKVLNKVIGVEQIAKSEGVAVPQ